MTKYLILFLMTFAFIARPASISVAGPGFSVISTPGTHETGEFIPASEGDISVISRPFSKKIETTSVLIRGNTVLVPVILGHRGKELSTWLVFDTGATMTLLHRNVGDKLGIVPVKSGKSTIADGTLIDTQMATLDYLIVGPYRMDNFQAIIIDHKNDSSMHKGLLGMNFLRNVDYTIDFTRKLIKWSNK